MMTRLFFTLALRISGLLTASLAFAHGSVRAQDLSITTYARLYGLNNDHQLSPSSDGAPSGIAFDSAGTLWVVDGYYQIIQAVASDGTQRRVAGYGGPGIPKNGIGASAVFASPSAIAIDAAGNAWVGETASIRKVTPAGVVTTAASFGATALVFDSAGNLYARAGSQLVRVLPDGGKLPLAGDVAQAGHVDGTGSAARLGQWGGLTADAAGNLFITESSYHTVRKITPAGVVTTVAGKADEAGSADGAAAVARFRAPKALVVDAAGSLYVGDTDNRTLRKISVSGLTTTVAGRVGASDSRDGVGVEAQFTGILSLALDRTGALYIGDGASSLSRAIRRLVDVPVAARIVKAPISTTVFAGGSAVFSVTAVGNPALTYRWQRWAVGTLGWVDLAEGGRYAGTATETLTVSAVDASMHRDGFRVVVTNSLGAEISDSGAGLFVSPPPVATITVTRPGAPMDPLVEGQTLTLIAGVASGGSATSYQWLKDSVEIDGATSAALSLTSLRLSDAGRYQVRILTGGVSVLSDVLPVSVQGSRLSNLSIRAITGAGAQTLTVGFFISRGALPVLVRGIGPALTSFGVASVVADPRLTLYRGEQVVDSGDNWSESSGVVAAAQRLGAFPLARGSLDAALLPALPDGAFTAQCVAATAGGTALVELYDAGTREAGRLTNVSARSLVGGVDGILIAGFSIIGNQPKSLLIRGVGPGLASFGLSAAISDPLLKVFNPAGAVQAQNDNWSDNGAAAAVSAAALSVGAFRLPEGSRDAAVVLTLSPGTYTAQLSTLSGPAGIGLIEIYELP